MSIDAGTIYSSIRVRLDQLDQDIKGAVGKFDSLGKSIEDAGKKYERLGKFGKEMTMKVTLPTIAAGAAAVKFASDYNESLGSVQTVFGEFAQKIDAFAKGAAENAGLSMTEVNEAATVLGATLQNAGYAMGDSADMALILTQRAADLAAMFGTSTTQALDAVKAALRGEADPIERFGIGVNEAAINAKALELGLTKVNGQLTQHDKVQARLAVILDQSARAAGRFAEEADGVGGKSKITTAQVKNMAITLGQDLLPIAADILDALSKVTKNLANMDEGTRKTIIAIAAFAAGTGPAISVVTSTAKAVEALKIAFVALSASPIGIATVAIGGFALALKAMGDANQAKMMDEAADKFKVISELAGVATEKIVSVEEAMANYSKGGGSIDELEESFAQIAEDTGLTREQIIAIGIQSDKVTTEFRKQLLVMKESSSEADKQKEAAKETRASIIGTVEWINAQRAAQEKLNKVVNEGKSPTGKDKKDEARIQAEKDFNEVIRQQEILYSTGNATFTEYRDAIYGAAVDQRDALLDAGFTIADAGTAGGDALIKMIDLINALKKGSGETAKAMQVDFRNIAENGIKQALSGFESIGEALVNGGSLWKAFAKAGVLAIASVLEALAAELAALAAKAAVYSFIPGMQPAALGVGTALAGSAAAYVAAGALKASAGKFENGGIVPGNSYTGDKMWAQVNSEEEILTRSDPRHSYNGGMNPTFILEVNGQILADIVAVPINAGTTRIKLA